MRFLELNSKYFFIFGISAFLIYFGLVEAEGLEDSGSFPIPHLYFGYGSNLSYAFLKERLKTGPWNEDGWTRSGEIEGPEPESLGNYELRDFEFGYTLDATPFGDKGTAGNVMPKKGARVCGALYRISEIHLQELDRTEDEPEAYKRVALKVHRMASENFHFDNDQDEQTAWVYVGNPKYVTQNIDPDPEYISLLVQSAIERLFPEEYIENYLRVNVLMESAK